MRTLFTRALLIAATFVVILGYVRVAPAYAPFCDPRAATNMAPPPFTEIPDVRFEPGADWFIVFCEQLEAARNLERGPEPSRNRFSEHTERTWPDIGAALDSSMIPRRKAAMRVPFCLDRSIGPSGIRTRVYRPPRETCCSYPAALR